MANQEATQTAITAKYYAGVAFDIAGKEIALNPSTAINEIKYEGLECALTGGRVDLGEVSQIFDNVLHGLGVKEDDFSWKKLKSTTKGIPIIESAADLLGDANLCIEEFYLKLPATHKRNVKNPNDATQDMELSKTTAPKKAPTQYTVGLSMIWDTQGTDADGKREGHLFGNIYLKGLYFKVEKSGPDPKQSAQSS
uniref:Uncharacterized protein n=1 Tax=Candidatus Kentrum sp. SD TaxID=2126332 RepID=A0A450YC60_9GAMM|nr:MAG: hypothetical protein BECKSD772F_GA0070984_100215 [Candidatus Kentron sp. SD]VFK39132.1 MAG: hypothetical protein BECKSD772E_GA0070983_100215 [Candidatus Kentron sp. SD]VFK77800.1 MAG: hypothetical protein BECKSD772D_GA0070982_100214 [Candidatus Kentron sp. SD]